MMSSYRIIIISLMLRIAFTAAPIPVNSSSSDLMPFDESTLSAAMAVKGKVQKSKDRVV